jgi:hypothetical protein
VRTPDRRSTVRPSGPGISAATVAISSAITCSAGEDAPPPRSNSSRYFATVQPSSISPRTFAFGTLTSSKKTWFWTSSPDVITNGRIWMPGEVMSINTNVMPCCFFAPRDVRTSPNIQLASRAWVVQILLPVHTRSSPSSTAAMDSDARSEPASGSEYPWQKNTSPVRMPAESTPSARPCRRR